MKLKKSLMAILAMSSVTGVAYADIPVLSSDKGSVEVYGIADAAIGTVQHSLSVDQTFPASVNPVSVVPKTVPNSVSGMFNGGISPSRFGIKGGMDIGNGMRAFFVLESGINVTTGRLSDAGACLDSNAVTATTACANSSIDGQIFSRQANFGLSDASLGSLALGKNYAPIFDIVVSYDPVQAAQLFSPLGFSGTYGGGGGISEDTRVDSSLKYKNQIGAFNFGALYKFGGSALGASTASAKSAYALSAGYEEGNIGVQAAYEVFTDGVVGAAGTVAPNTVNITNENTSAYMIAAKYKVTDAATAKIGYESYTVQAPSDQLAIGGFSYYGQTVGKVTNYTDNQKTNIYWIGGDYNFTEKLNLAAGYYNVAIQQSANGSASGTLTYTSLLLDYKLTKTFDTYLGFMNSNFSGAKYPSATDYTSNQIYAIGGRFKF